MRDALSILDKIASFTNGELNYTSTSEHLNILDADFYFKLVDCMQQQDLSGAMLLYDEINRKGFEGDLLLNGFAEFIRNLLVCKDEKAAVLLEVVENFKDKYIDTAKKASVPLLISALNILNEAEINYKAARNKRLHVELALIKLCYLQQALELSVDPDSYRDVLSKKKLTDRAKAVAFRQIIPFQVKSEKIKNKTAGSSGEAKLIVEVPAWEKISLEEENSGYDITGTTNQLPIAIGTATTLRQAQDQQSAYAKATADKPATSNKLSPLDKIRKQYQNNGKNGNGNVNHELNEEVLRDAWAGYIKKLKAEKNPAAHSFEMALLRIRDSNSFEAVTADTIEKQFIEQDRNRLFSFLQEQLHNRLLQFNVLIEEKAEGKPKPEISLSAKEQYQKMAEQFPLVKELKDKLRLELDY